MANNPIEATLLRSILEYPAQGGAILWSGGLKYFSPEGRALAELINRLHEEGRDGTAFFLAAVPPAAKKTELFADLLQAAPSMLFDEMREDLIKQWRLKRQIERAEELRRAAENGVLMSLGGDEDDEDGDPGLLNNFKRLGELKQEFASREPKERLRTGLLFLDNGLGGGVETGQLMLISGDAEAGKTTIGTQMLEEFSRKATVAFFAFEFTLDAYVKSPGANRYKESNTNLFATNENYDVDVIAAQIRALHKQQGVKYFLIDSQMRMETSAINKLATTEEKESYKFSTLAKLCHSLDIFVMLIIQTAKGQTDSPLGTKKGEHEASIIMRLEKMEPPRADVRQMDVAFDEFNRKVILKKNKQTGKHFEGIVGFDPTRRRFFTHERDEAERTLDIDYRKELGLPPEDEDDKGGDDTPSAPK